jgi:vacuolar protein sorting-associated protein 13A/C
LGGRARVCYFNLIFRKSFDTEIKLPTLESSETDLRMYFERFFLQPVKINVSFARTLAKSKETEERPRSQNILSFIFDVFTMAVGNIHVCFFFIMKQDAPIKMNALELHHPILTSRKLLSNIMTFYSQEVVGQIHKVIGSADVLGNPVGLFNSVSSGVNDLFYEPIHGFDITRPQDFGIGLAKGSASLFKKTVFGFSDTLSKFTGSISKGLSVVTLDADFQERRRVSGIRNKPRHAVYGVTQGFSSFARSVGSGVEGLVVCLLTVYLCVG